MREIIYRKSLAVREIRKRVPLTGPGQGFTTIPDGKEEVWFSTSIYPDQLQEMARKAAANKSGICRDGALEVRVISRNRLS